MVREQDHRNYRFSKRPNNDQNGGGTNNDVNNEIYGKKSRTGTKYGLIKKETKTILLKYFCSPISAITDVNEFRQNLLLSDPKNKDYVQASFKDFGIDINELSLREIYDLLSKEDCQPLFMTSMMYGNREISLKWLNDLLLFQFNDDIDAISNFLTTVVDIVDKKIPKLNTLVILSPPSAGKNFFFDTVFAVCLNYGQLGKANRFDQFAFQEAPNKRILLWNEPNYESSLTDTIKLITGGDPYTVRVKHMADQHVKRTPLIVLTNNTVGFMTDQSFKDRVVIFRWKYAEFLAQIELKPYPMAFFDLLNKYNIEF